MIGGRFHDRLSGDDRPGEGDLINILMARSCFLLKDNESGIICLEINQEVDKNFHFETNFWSMMLSITKEHPIPPVGKLSDALETASHESNHFEYMICKILTTCEDYSDLQSSRFSNIVFMW